MSSAPIVIKAAREMARIHAEACNVNKDDLWAIEGQSFIDEAQSVLDACGAPDLLAALQEVYEIAEGPGRTDRPQWERARAAIAKATGAA